MRYLTSPFSRRLAGAVSLVALAAGAAGAQDAQPAEDAAVTDVIEVRSAPLQVTTDEMVGAVEVISSDVILRTFNGSLGDTLDRFPGVNSTYFGPASGRPIIRGLGADRVRVLLDGLGGIDAADSSPDHAVAAEALGAEQIEVLRGPAAIAYGGGAIGGVVNVLDGRIPSARVDGPFDGFVYAGATTVDEGTQLAGRATTEIGPLVVQLDLLRRDADGFDIPGFAETEARREEEHHDDHDEGHDDDHEDEHEDEEPEFGTVEDAFYTFETASIGASLVQNWGFVGLAVKQTDADYGLPGHSHAHEEEHGDEDHDDDHEDEHDHEEEEGPAVIDLEQTRIDLRGQVNRDGFFNRIRFAFAHADYQHAELEGGDEIGTVFDKEGFEGRIEIAHAHDGPRQGAWGVQVLTQDFQADGEEAFIEPVTTQDWGVFLTERWDNGGWGLEGGLRVETRKLNGLRAERRYDTFSASGSVFARPNDATFLAATLSHTERAPTDVEVFAFGPHLATETFEIGDLDLDTETAWSAEGTARWANDRARAELNVFYADYDGFIELFPTGEEEDELPIFEYRQEDANFWGFEVAGDLVLGDLAGWAFTADAAVDFVRGELDAGGDLPRIPPLTALVGLEAERGIWSARAEAKFVAEQDEIAEFETETDGYTLVNADLVVAPFAEYDVDFLVGVRNLTDEEARVHTSFLKDQVPLPGQSVRFAVRAAF